MRRENILLASRCRSNRATRGLSVSELSRISSVSPRTIKRVEAADMVEYDPKMSTVASLARALNVTVQQLVA